MLTTIKYQYATGLSKHFISGIWYSNSNIIGNSFVNPLKITAQQHSCDSTVPYIPFLQASTPENTTHRTKTCFSQAIQLRGSLIPLSLKQFLTRQFHSFQSQPLYRKPLTSSTSYFPEKISSPMCILRPTTCNNSNIKEMNFISDNAQYFVRLFFFFGCTLS